MAIQTFTALQVLTAAQQNALQTNDFNQTVSTKTASYTLVAADKGTKIVMNSASATTITVNTSLFAAGDTLTILNIAAGVCTVTAGTATVSTAGTLALVANGGGTLYFTSAGVSVFQADGVAVTASGLTLISATTIGTTVSSVTVSNAFSATYDNYKIILSGGVGSAAETNLNMILGSTVTGYYWGKQNVTFLGVSGGDGASNTSNVPAGGGSATALIMNLDIQSPFLAKNTIMLSGLLYARTISQMSTVNGYLDNTTSYTAFTLTPGSGTLTGGTIRVYGYQNS